jgi:hypothetical protein
MGTRHLTLFVNQEQEEICVMYGQYDGHPERYGKGLAEFLASTSANGMSCLTAQVIAHFKKGVGNFYIYSRGTRDVGEEFIYTVYPGTDGNINLKLQGGCVTFFGMAVLFDGPANTYDADKAYKVLAETYKEIPNDFLEKNK